MVKAEQPELRRRGKKLLAASSDVRNQVPSQPYGIDRLATVLYAGIPTIITVLILYFWYQNQLLGRVSSPSTLPAITVRERSEVVDRFWGTYRPGVYFGTTYRSPKAFVTGLMWFEQLQGTMPHVRHQCDQGDGLPKYGWLKHDGRSFGVQEIEDTNFRLRTDFLKRPTNGTAGDWTARITISAKPGAHRPSPVVSLLYYVVDDDISMGTTRMQPVVSNGGELVSLRGSSHEEYDPEGMSMLGQQFGINFKGSGTGMTKHNYLATYISGRQLVKDVVMVGMAMYNWKQGQYIGLKGQLVPKDVPGPNTFVYQITGSLPLTLDVIFESGGSGKSEPLTGSVFDAELSRHVAAFDAKFSNTFGLEARGYPPQAIAFAQAALSNLMGGIGYFFGTSIVQSTRHPEPVDAWPTELYTAVPSRSFFPRGFLWDEGFHNLLISRWDEQISRDIIGHWLNLANVDGWIPREQILGEEARARVPSEFVVQRDENANPPTLFLPLYSIVRRLLAGSAGVSAADKQFLADVFPRLKLWYTWFNSSQSAASSAFSAYRWRGRDSNAVRELNPKTLTSGLDDYPRASHPTDDERHIDLRCWVALASTVMADIARALGEADSNEYVATRDLLHDGSLLDALHWSDEGKRYADYGLHTAGVRLERPPPPKHLQPGQPTPHLDKVRVVTKEPSRRLVTEFFGYVSLFPLLLKVLKPDAPNLNVVLTDLRREDLLWTNYGLRSLARSSPLYGKHNTEHDPPYWRGRVWINMNYLAISALHYYGTAEGPHRQLARTLYDDLRANVVRNVVNEYGRTGYIWEQYDDMTGQGRGAHPFTGWSALVTLIMAEEY